MAQGAEGNPGAANGVPPPVPGGQFRLMGPGAGPVAPGGNAPVVAGQGGLPRRPLPQAIVEFQDLVAAAAQPAPLRPLEPPPPGQDIGQMLMAQMVERADAMALRMQRDGVGGGAAIRHGLLNIWTELLYLTFPHEADLLTLRTLHKLTQYL